MTDFPNNDARLDPPEDDSDRALECSLCGESCGGSHYLNERVICSPCFYELSEVQADLQHDARREEAE